jgi:hypothetical protein
MKNKRNDKRTFESQKTNHDVCFKKLFTELVELHKKDIITISGRVYESGIVNHEILAIIDKWKNYCNKMAANPKVLAKPLHTGLKTYFDSYKEDNKVQVFTKYIIEQCKEKYNMSATDVDLLMTDYKTDVNGDIAVHNQFNHLLTSYKGLKLNPDAIVPKYIRYNVYVKHFFVTKWGNFITFIKKIIKL